MQTIALSRRDLLLGLCAASTLRVARADLYDDYINSKSKQPFVAFLARKGLPGHAFVGIGVRLEAGLVVYERFFGYYPTGANKAEQTKLVFGKTSGSLEHRWADMSWDLNYVVPIDDTKQAAALKVADTWRSNDPKYNLFAREGKNCSTFAAEVAVAVGLVAPSGAGSMLPINFIEKLRAANP